MRNIFNSFDATVNRNSRAARMFRTNNSYVDERPNQRMLSYEPNQPEDEIVATAIVNEMEIEKSIRFHADNS